MRRKLLTAMAVAALTMPVGVRGAGGATVDLPRRSAEGAKVDAKALLERLKALEGTWAGPEKDGRRATTTFEIVGDGTVVMEHYANPAMPGGGHMVSAYHLDGDDLILTHYCIAKNQPTLKASRFDPATSEVQFEFLRGTNIPTRETGHMRRAMYRFTDADHFTTEWEFFKGGKLAFTETETFTRMK